MVGLRALIAVGDHGSVIGAARALGFTPSAISQQIKRLERETRVGLVERVGRGVALTEAARVLVEDGRQLFGQVEVITSRLEVASGTPHTALRMASFATAMRGLVVPVLADLAREVPDLEVTVLERDPAESVSLVADGQADLGVIHDFVGVPLHRPAHVQGRQIGVDRVDVLLPADHRLAAARSVRAAELVGESWASTPVGSICHEWFVQMFASHTHLPRVRFWSGEYATHIALVRAGLAVSLLPRLGRPDLPEGVVTVPVLDPAPTRQVTVVWRDTMAESPSIREVASRLEALASGTERGGD